MASRRMLKAAEAIREVVSMAILTEIRDPRVQHVTVTGVDVASDMRTAKVMVSIMGDESVQKLCLRGLANAAGFLQSKVAKRIDTRYTPRLSFEIDEGVKKSLEVGRILQQIAKEREQSESGRHALPERLEPDDGVTHPADHAAADQSEAASLDAEEAHPIAGAMKDLK